MADTIRFSIHTNPKVNEEGKVTYHVRHDAYSTVGLGALIKHLENYNKLMAQQVKMGIDTLEDEIPEFLANNRQLHIDGLGTFFLKLGFRERLDENEKPVKRQFTNPEDITGNDVCIDSIGFIPDQSLVDNVRRRAPYFENCKGRGVVGHSAGYTEEQMRERILQWFTESKYLTVRHMRMFFGLTEYMARKWLKELSEGPEALLQHQCINGTHTYWLRDDSRLESRESATPVK